MPGAGDQDEHRHCPQDTVPAATEPKSKHSMGDTGIAQPHDRGMSLEKWYLRRGSKSKSSLEWSAKRRLFWKEGTAHAKALGHWEQHLQGAKRGHCGWIAEGCGIGVQGELERPAGVGQMGLCSLVEPKRTQEFLRGVRARAGLFWKSPHIPSAKPWVLPNM